MTMMVIVVVMVIMQMMMKIMMTMYFCTARMSIYRRTGGQFLALCPQQSVCHRMLWAESEDSH